jgi:hypothetical protein
MLWDVISNQWVWLSAAAIFAVLLGGLAAYGFRHSKPREEIQDLKNGWTATGRIDFLDPDAVGSFVLQAEVTRIVTSLGGIEHREIRWRRATLDEAKKVVVAYHAQRNLATAAAFDVKSSSGDRVRSLFGDEHENAPVENGGVTG